jgi:hypothetical protein
MIKVDGENNLFRQTNSDAIINNDVHKYNEFLIQRANVQRSLAIEERVNNLETKLDSILNILLKQKDT